jgi:hypothetical protein
VVLAIDREAGFACPLGVGNGLCRLPSCHTLC